MMNGLHNKNNCTTTLSIIQNSPHQLIQQHIPNPIGNPNQILKVINIDVKPQK